MKTIFNYIDIKFTKLNLGIILVLITFVILASSVLVLKLTSTTQVASNECIVTINGSKYDVTDFKSIHPGGDVFKCGEDISNEFNARHDESVLVNVDKVD